MIWDHHNGFLPCFTVIMFIFSHSVNPSPDFWMLPEPETAREGPNLKILDSSMESDLIYCGYVIVPLFIHISCLSCQSSFK